MYSWNVEETETGEYILLNRSRTVIRLSEHSFIDLAEILSKIEEADVPISFTDGLKEIYFTILGEYDEGRHLAGDYKDGVIRISTHAISRSDIPQTFVHELAHHVDIEYDISLKKKIIEEKPKAARFMPDRYARKDISEYVACGFEVFYFGTREQRGTFRKSNPRLYNVISYLHRSKK